MLNVILITFVISKPTSSRSDALERIKVRGLSVTLDNGKTLKTFVP